MAVWAQPEPIHQPVDRIVLALCEDLHGPFVRIPYPAMEAKGAGRDPGSLAIADALHPSSHDRMDRFHNRKFMIGNSYLAVGTEERGPSPHHYPFDPAATSPAGQALAAVNPQPGEVIPRLAVR